MARTFNNHYATLGIHSSATADEIRRAYRILARRYHPDLNPGAASEDKFKKISEAYGVLSDAEKRRLFDIDFENQQRISGEKTHQYARDARRAYSAAEKRRETAKDRHQRHNSATQRAKSQGNRQPQRRPGRSPVEPGPAEQLSQLGKGLASFTKRAIRTVMPQRSGEPGRSKPPTASGISKVSIIEVSISIRDAIVGVKKTIEVAEPQGARKLSVSIPAGSRTGSVVRLRNKNTPEEELVLIVRVSNDPILSIHPKGLVAEIPITVQEAIAGASITVPTLEDPVVVRIPPGTQSGSEVRLKGKGIAARDGERGDLFLRLMIKIPESFEAVGIKERAAELDPYYGTDVRAGLPKLLTDI